MPREGHSPEQVLNKLRQVEVAEARSLCPRIHCRLPEATVCKPRSSIHVLFGACTVFSTEHA